MATLEKARSVKDTLVIQHPNCAFGIAGQDDKHCVVARATTLEELNAIPNTMEGVVIAKSTVGIIKK